MYQSVVAVASNINLDSSLLCGARGITHKAADCAVTLCLQFSNLCCNSDLPTHSSHLTPTTSIPPTGEDPFLTGAMGEAFTTQLQRPDPTSKYLRTAAVTRHLVVYSGPESLKDDGTQGADRFSFNANVTERDLEDYFYPPFEVRS